MKTDNNNERFASLEVNSGVVSDGISEISLDSFLLDNYTLLNGWQYKKFVLEQLQYINLVWIRVEAKVLLDQTVYHTEKNIDELQKKIHLLEHNDLKLLSKYQKQLIFLSEVKNKIYHFDNLSINNKKIGELIYKSNDGTISDKEKELLIDLQGKNKIYLIRIYCKYYYKVLHSFNLSNR